MTPLGSVLKFWPEKGSQGTLYQPSQSETGHTAPQWCIAPVAWYVQHTPFDGILFWQSGGGGGQHLPFHCLSVNPLRKADLYGSVVGLFKHTYYN